MTSSISGYCRDGVYFIACLYKVKVPVVKSDVFIESCDRAFVQVVELHTKLRALSAVARQQAEELGVWRLSSQPPPLFQNHAQASGVSQSQSDHYQTLGVLGSHGTVMVARTDGLLLSCSSSRLQGHMLNSRYYTQ